MGRRPNPWVPAWLNPRVDPKDDVVIRPHHRRPTLAVTTVPSASYEVAAAGDTADVTVAGSAEPAGVKLHAWITPPPVDLDKTGNAFTATLQASVGNAQHVTVRTRNWPDVSFVSAPFNVVVAAPPPPPPPPEDPPDDPPEEPLETATAARRRHRASK
jgi:hypothetical protein